MKTFLFEQYGYYPEFFENNQFSIDNWLFKLIEIDYDDELIKKIDEYLSYVREKFANKGAFIIKTRFGKLTSVYDGKRYVLVSNYKTNITLKDINTFHYLFQEQNKNLDLQNLLSVWEERTANIEKSVVGSLRIDSIYYQKNLEVTMYALGLAQNAMQYISEIIFDYRDKIENLTLTHRRLSSFDSFEFFNPLNYIVDHPLRDIAELYKNNLLQYDDLIEFMRYYKFDGQTASLLMARIMYPNTIFDLLENTNDAGLRLNYNIEKENLKIKSIYLYLKKQYNIRPINWLEN